MAQYENKGDRLNILLADELPEDMTGQQDTQRICGNCAWYSFRKLESTCGKTGREVAFFANKECFTTDKDMDMEENNNAQPVAESTGTQVCKECGRILPLEDFQRRRNGNVDNVCKACRAEKARIGIARKKEKKVDIPEQKPAESEDERIRKAIIELLKEVGRDDTGISENAKCMIAYHEKQKEQKPEVISPGTYVADLSDAALLDELRRRGYKGRISKCDEVEI